jgi:hypothetical protein
MTAREQVAALLTDEKFEEMVAEAEPMETITDATAKEFVRRFICDTLEPLLSELDLLRTRSKSAAS